MPRLVEENVLGRLLINNLDKNSTINGVENDFNHDVQKIKIVLLWSSYDRSDSVFKANDPAPTRILECNPDPEKYEFHVESIDKHTAISTVQKFIEEKKYDLYINFCDGAEYHDTAGVEVAEYFWRQNSVPFVSPTVHFYLFSKFQMKFVAQSCGITTPLYFFVYKLEDLDNLKKSIYKNLKFPMLVKHHNGAGSEGLYKNCLVYCSKDLEDRIADTVKNYGGALVEEFVNGREFTVLVQENPENSDQPIVYHPFECMLPDTDSFKDFGRKFVDFETLEWRAVDEKQLAIKLRNMTKRMFVACGANTFARCDYRMDKKTGEIYFLEINSLPGVFYPKLNYGSADFILDHEGKFQFFLENLLKCAWRNFRDEKRRSPTDRATTVNGPICGFLTSKKILRKNEPVVDLTLLPNRLVNRNEFNRFPDEVRKFFDPTSVPITKNLRLWLYNAWQNCREFEVTAIKRSSSDAEVNCTLDANLTLVAIRDIAENEMVVLGENFA